MKPAPRPTESTVQSPAPAPVAIATNGGRGALSGGKASLPNSPAKRFAKRLRKDTGVAIHAQRDRMKACQFGTIPQVKQPTVMESPSPKVGGAARRF